MLIDVYLHLWWCSQGTTDTWYVIWRQIKTRQANPKVECNLAKRRQLAEDFLKDCVHINIGALELSANHNVLQIVDVRCDIEKDEKRVRLTEETMSEKEKKTTGFVETK
ncbi:hypothetical protein QTO34_016587, partial [Cnephaeus nilssonii]